MNEPALIQEAQRGDLDSFNTLVLHYQDIVFSALVRMTGDADFAADATQEAFIRAFAKIRSYHGGSFRAWLLRIATNAILDEMRRGRAHPVISLEVELEGRNDIEDPIWLADPAMTPEQRAEAAEIEHAVQHCLDALPPDARRTVVLADVQALDYHEVAAALGVRVGTIKSRLARARVQLRDCLRGFEELLPAVFRLQEEGSAR